MPQVQAVIGANGEGLATLQGAGVTPSWATPRRDRLSKRREKFELDVVGVTEDQDRGIWLVGDR